MTVRVSFDGAAKGAIEKVDVEITSVVVAGGLRLPAERLTQAETLAAAAVPPAQPVLIGAADRLWLAVGTVSATACLIGRGAWRFEEIEPQWNQLILRSSVHHAAVHEGTLATFVQPRELIARWTGNKRLGAGVAVFCGGLTVESEFPPPISVEIELNDPVLKRKLFHRYTLEARPLVS